MERLDIFLSESTTDSRARHGVSEPEGGVRKDRAESGRSASPGLLILLWHVPALNADPVGQERANGKGKDQRRLPG